MYLGMQDRVLRVCYCGQPAGGNKCACSGRATMVNRLDMNLPENFLHMHRRISRVTVA